MTTSPKSNGADPGLLDQFLDHQIDSAVDAYLRNLATQRQHDALNTQKLDTLLNAIQVIGQRLDALDKIKEVLLPVPSTAPAAQREPKVGDLLCAGEGYPELVLLPAGSFQMGSTKNSNEQPVHKVSIASFAMGKYPVTQAQWQKVMGNNPSIFDGDDNRPVEKVSWDDAQAFIQKLNQLTSLNYRLPSEAEWEYACRAGSTGQWCFGNDESQLREYAWYDLNSGTSSRAVGLTKPNAFGLYDMHGNVWEWCEDEWHDDYKGAFHDGRAWVSGDKSYRVMRGGFWAENAINTRAATRELNRPDNRLFYIGFRVARTAP